MIYRTSKSEIAKYRESEALSQSDLKKLLGGLDNFMKEDSEKQSLPMIIGSAVDTILTGEPGDFENEFHVMDIPKPSELMESMLMAVYERAEDKEASLQELINVVEEVVIGFNYQSNWKIDTRISKVVENFLYYEELKKCAGKTVLSPADMDVINNVVDSLRNCPVTKDLFTDYTDNFTDIYYQLPLFWENNGIKCKGLLDIVVVKKDVNGDTVSVTPYDLKTLSDRTLNFSASMKMRRYDIQAAWYAFGLQASKDRLPFKFPVESHRNFRFVVESTTSPGEPVIYECSSDLLNVGYTGLPDLVVNNRLIRKETLGFIQLLDLYKYYEQQGWRREKALEESNNTIILDWDYLTYTHKVDGREVWKKI